jgi:peptide/nickel transport system substrate-binding protein
MPATPTGLSSTRSLDATPTSTSGSPPRSTRPCLFPTSDGLGVQPGLATEWACSGGGKTLSLTLRQGVESSDGTPMTADDVKFSLDRRPNRTNGAWNEMLGWIDAVEIAADDIVVLKLKRPLRTRPCCRRSPC